MQAYAHLINAISGMMDLDRGGEAQPRVAYLQAADVLAGAHAFGAICAALVRRGRNGRGAYLDVSMLECLVAADDITYGAMLNGGKVQREPRIGMVVHPIGGRYLAMQSAGAPHLWSRLVALIGHPELATDERFATPMARRTNWHDSAARSCATGSTASTAWTRPSQTLAAARIPAVPMLSPEEVIEHPQTGRARSHFRKSSTRPRPRTRDRAAVPCRRHARSPRPARRPIAWESIPASAARPRLRRRAHPGAAAFAGGRGGRRIGKGGKE